MNRFLLIFVMLMPLMASASPQQQQQGQGGDWQYMGWVTLYEGNSNHNQDCGPSVNGMLYCHFDGNGMRLKVFVPSSGCSYKVVPNGSYNPRQINYDNQHSTTHTTFTQRMPNITTGAKRYYLDPSYCRK